MKWIILTPLIAFITLMILLYIPAVQDVIRKEATQYASKATGMQINVGRIDLRFPLNLLIRDIEVIKVPDTLLTLKSLNVKVQAIPLIKGRMEIDNLLANKLKVNSSHLIDGMQIKGELQKFYLKSHGVTLSLQEATINEAELQDAQINLKITEPNKPQNVDTTTTPAHWKINLHKLNLNNVAFGMENPKDSTMLYTKLEDITIQKLGINLKEKEYTLNKFIVENTLFNYNNQIMLDKINIQIDSVLYKPNNIYALIKECNMYEKTGINVTSLTGKIVADSSTIQVPDLRLLSAHSNLTLMVKTNWEFVNNPNKGEINLALNGEIGKQDIMILGMGLPKELKEKYPTQPLKIEIATKGNLEQLQVSQIDINLPDAITLNSKGELYNLTDSLARSGNIDIQIATQNINFLPITIPKGINMDARVHMDGQNINTNLLFTQDKGSIKLDAAINLATEIYKANLSLADFKIQNFLPADSIYNITANIAANGKGLDILSPRSICSIKGEVNHIQYTKYNINGITLQAELKNLLAKAHLNINNKIIKMNADGEYNLAYNYPNGEINIDVEKLENISFKFRADVKKESIIAQLVSGDLNLNISTDEGVNNLVKQGTQFGTRLSNQLKDRKINLDALREAMPPAHLELKAGNKNFIAEYLDNKKIYYNKINVDFNTNSTYGINGYVFINKLRLDTLQLDTTFLTLKQDTNKLVLNCGIPTLNINGTVTNNDAEVLAKYINPKGETGLLFGINARSMTNNKGSRGGIVFTLIPQQPILAGKKFKFIDNKNWIFLHNNNRVYANVDMGDNQGVGVKIISMPTDTTSLQNINLDLSNIELEQLFSFIPNMPQLKGLLSAQIHYIQTEENLQLTGDVNIKQLLYNKQNIGDLGIGGTWLPGIKGEQQIKSYITLNNNKILTANGKLLQTQLNKDSIEINTILDKFPVSLANTFIPNDLAKLQGNLDGNLNIDGYLSSPIINGNIQMDSVVAISAQYGARLILDNHPLDINNNKLIFNNFSIYTTNNNPFTINGDISLADFTDPIANLKLHANNYILLDAKKTKESLVYGKVAVDIDATLKGPISTLAMRGNISLLGSTNATYILTDSPLTVQDRLNGLVTFTDFADTTSLSKQEVPTVSLGGLDMVMSISIDPNVQLKVDLSQDQSSKVQLQGGGNLTLVYTPQGELTLTGRYTLSGGIIKYTLPVIPLKEFQIVNGSYVEWTGNPMDPILNLSAVEKIKASVGQENGSSRMVQFEISIIVKNSLEDLSLAFDINAPNDAQVQNQLTTMGPDERQKNAIAMLATGVYLANSGKGGFNMDNAINSVLSNQINNLMGNIKGASFSVGIDNNNTSTGASQTDYSFSYSQRFFNDRFQIIIGGKVSTGAEADNSNGSFIDNVRLEYRLDNSGTRYLQLFYDKNYESILEGEVTEAGIGIVLRRKMDKLKELFIFSSKDGKKKK